jgi:ribosomal protein S24E
VASLKVWRLHEDKILSDLSARLLDRRLFKVKFLSDSNAPEIAEIKSKIIDDLKVDESLLDYYFTQDVTSNSTYNAGDEKIKIVFKTGEIKEITKVENTLISQGLLVPIKKHYICYIAH